MNRRRRLYLSLRANPDAPDPTTPEWRAAHPYNPNDPEADTAAFVAAMDAHYATVTDPCRRCGRHHDRLWTVRRALVDTMGHFPVYRLNGEEVPVDPSLPHTVDRLPRDAEPVDPDTAAALWHSDNESHVFGGPNIAAALRAAIADTNANARRPETRE